MNQKLISTLQAGQITNHEKSPRMREGFYNRTKRAQSLEGLSVLSFSLTRWALRGSAGAVAAA